jgi:hypothetical protein
MDFFSLVFWRPQHDRNGSTFLFARIINSRTNSKFSRLDLFWLALSFFFAFMIFLFCLVMTNASYKNGALESSQKPSRL